MRPCLEQPCTELTALTRCDFHRRLREQRRNAGRAGYYDAEWVKHSALRRSQESTCQACGLGFVLGRGALSSTVDHPTDAVLHRSCHSKLEAQRRKGAA